MTRYPFLMCLAFGHALKFIRPTTIKEKRDFKGARGVHYCGRCQRTIRNMDVPADYAARVTVTERPGSISYIYNRPTETLPVGDDVPLLDSTDPPSDIIVS